MADCYLGHSAKYKEFAPFSRQLAKKSRLGSGYFAQNFPEFSVTLLLRHLS